MATVAHEIEIDPALSGAAVLVRDGDAGAARHPGIVQRRQRAAAVPLDVRPLGRARSRRDRARCRDGGRHDSGGARRRALRDARGRPAEDDDRDHSMRPIG